jgi:hypothetical protein
LVFRRHSTFQSIDVSALGGVQWDFAAAARPTPTLMAN